MDPNKMGKGLGSSEGLAKVWGQSRNSPIFRIPYQEHLSLIPTDVVTSKNSVPGAPVTASCDSSRYGAGLRNDTSGLPFTPALLIVAFRAFEAPNAWAFATSAMSKRIVTSPGSPDA